eukprot:m.66539 g.66539  ORF g.66539 m.66539 type:complete len:265 (+) comp35392_c0_seq2:124-918(+)
MASTMSTHLERTEEASRNKRTSKASIVNIKQESTTVKSLILSVMDRKFKFKAGQWVDFLISDEPIVGGFSITSTPSELASQGIIRLAVKASDHPPAAWVHQKATVGSLVTLRPGGDFCFDLESNEKPLDLMFLAGGIGINPLYSIIQHAAEIRQGGGAVGKLRLLYSAKSIDELIFRNSLEDFDARGLLQCKYCITGAHEEHAGADDIHVGRISLELLENFLRGMDRNNLKVYICGPPLMADSMCSLLKHLGVKDDQLAFEKWW